MSPVSVVTPAAAMATEPTQFWWAAPSVTLAAVLVAFSTSMRSLRLQRRALEDNRRLRISDDVREVLAEALRDLHLYIDAVRAAQRVLELNRGRRRFYDAIGEADIPESRVEVLRQEIAGIESQIEGLKRAGTDAYAAVILQAERLGMLLGHRHPLMLDQMMPIGVYLAGIEDMKIWELPIYDADGAAAYDAERERLQLQDRAVELTDDLSAAGYAYVQEQFEPPRRTARIWRSTKEKNK